MAPDGVSPRKLVTEIWYPSVSAGESDTKESYNVQDVLPPELLEKLTGVTITSFPRMRFEMRSQTLPRLIPRSCLVMAASVLGSNQLFDGVLSEPRLRCDFSGPSRKYVRRSG